MRISIKAKPAAKVDEVEKLTDDSYVVSVKEPPVQGRANQAIIRLVADYFSIPVNSVRIVTGWTSRNKVVEITQQR